MPKVTGRLQSGTMFFSFFSSSSPVPSHKHYAHPLPSLYKERLAPLSLFRVVPASRFVCCMTNQVLWPYFTPVYEGGEITRDAHTPCPVIPPCLIWATLPRHLPTAFLSKVRYLGISIPTYSGRPLAAFDLNHG